MVLALVVGDPHFKISNIRETDIMTKDIIMYAHKHSPDFIVVLGDILDRHEIIHVTPLTRAISFLDQLRNIAPTYALIGNHDLKNNQEFLSQEHPFTALKSWSNLTVVDYPFCTTIKDELFVFVPYVPPGRFEEALNHVPQWDKARCIFAHQEFKGCQMGPTISINGDVWDSRHPLVISGHIHDYQKPQPNILYAGTPIQHSYGDRSDKGILLSHFHKKEHMCTRLSLSVPIKHIVRLSYAQIASPPKISGEAKIIISGTTSEIKGLHQHALIEEWKKSGHKVVFKAVCNTNSFTPTLAVRTYRQELIQSLENEPVLLDLYHGLMQNK